MKSIFNPKFFSLYQRGLLKETLTKDILSGIIVGIVALPLAIAFAVASGVSPEKGLITAIIAGFIISLLGGSRVQIGGPTGAFIVIVYGILQEYGPEGLMISTILAGIILVGFGLLQMGALLKFIPHPLIVGFTSGIALVIFTTQIKDALGLQLADLPSGFAGKWVTYIQHVPQTHIPSLLMTVGAILITLFTPKITSKVPGSFLAIILCTLSVSLFNLEVNTIETMFGTIPQTISFSLPTHGFGNITNYIAPAFTIAILGAIESLLSAVVADGMIGGHHRSNTELIAQGVANIVAPFFGGIPATGAIARTATNIKNGGRTPIAGMIHAVVLLLIMLFFGKWALLIPMPCLAGILIIVAVNMSEWRSFRALLKGSRYDILILLSTFFLTVFVDLSIAIEIGVVMSSLLFMYRMSNKCDVSLFESDKDSLESEYNLPDGIDVYEVSGPFFFGAAKQYQEALRSISYQSKVIILRMRHVPFIDSTGYQNLKAIASELQDKNIALILSGVQEDVLKELIRNQFQSEFDAHKIMADFASSTQEAKKILKNFHTH